MGPRVLVEQIDRANQLLACDLLRPRQRTVLFTLLGGLGLVLALVGVFGINGVRGGAAHAGNRRADGLRRARRSGRGDDGARFRVADCARNDRWAGAALATRVIASFLFNTTPTDPATFAVVAIVLAVVGCLAAWVPARRAARVDPVAALRTD